MHAHCRGILLPWLLLLGLAALLSGLIWVIVQRVPVVSSINGLALSLARHYTGFAAAGNARWLRLLGRYVTARRSPHTGGPTSSKPRSVKCLRCKGCFMLWMLLTPQVHGVQVVRQGAIHGQPVFSTGTVPGTRNLQDLRPVRVPNLPVTGSDSLVVDDGYRDICVFAPDLRGCHTALLVDVRLRGRALEVSICRALGRQAAEWECCRLLEALPALPPEQYVLRRTSVSWHLSVVPVDLRPIGGTIALAYADRVMPCGAIAHMAIADQPSLGCPEDFLCRTSHGWFAPDAALLLLPHCDAFQVWPLHLTQSAPPPATLSLLRQTSGSELLATSLEPTEGVERAYSHHFDGQAVIIARNGLVYVPIAAYADQDSIRSSALLAYLGPSGLGIEYGGLTHFARVLPPLPDLPAVQFVAGSCDGHGQPTVVDLRAIHGSLHVCCTDSDATPAQRIEAAIHSGGEPDPAHPVVARLSQGMLQVLHREQAVSPFAPLLAPPPAPLVVLRRHSNVGTGWDDAHTTLGDTSHAKSFSVAASFCIVASVLSGPAPRSGWAAVFLLRYGLSAFSAEAVPPPVSSDDGGTPASGTYDGWQTFDAKDDRLTEVGSLASAAEHVRLALRLYCSPSGSPLGWDASSSSTGVRTAFFRFVVWSPHGQHVAFLPKDSTFARAHDMIGRLRAMPDRGKPVLVQPQAFMHAVQLVSPSNDPGLITVLVDTGHDRICLDVSRKTVGASILSALSLLCPGHTFQLDPQLPVTARSGHVVLACHDPTCEVDMGTCVVPFPTTASHSWLQNHDEVLLTAADLGLVRLKVPRGYCMQRLQTAVQQWLGKSRCAGVRLQQVQAPGVGFSIFCLPRPGASTLTVVLSDICDSLGEVLVATVDSPTEGALPLSHLLHGCHSEFWKDVLSRDPSPRTCVLIPAAQSATGFPYVQVRLGLDYARARLHGWRPGLVSQVHTADLVGHAGALGIHWDILDDIRRGEAAVKTVPLHWPIQASPLVSVSAPVRRWAQRCIPAEGFFPAGTYYQLECPFMGVSCQVPCLPQYHLWAVRLADDVYGACTRSITWHDIAQVAGITAWDLPQTLIHEGMLSWEWPQDLTALSGHCGQVFCQGDVVEKRQDCAESFSPEHRDLNDDAVSMPDVGPAVSGRHSAASLAILGWRYHGRLFGFLTVLTLPMLVGGTRDDSPDQVSSPVLGEVGYGFNSTQTCSVAWCHELACQSTHFAVTAHSLAAYFRAHSPFEIVRILLWKPLAGPLAFEVSRDSRPAELERMLHAAGHQSDHGLIVAFDTLTTSVDLLSVPVGPTRPTIWWIIRDGIARELLRPVALWHEDHSRYVVTLNSHGQANAVTCSPEVAALRRLPQGARGYTSMPFPRIFGHLTHQGLVLTEAAIGALVAASGGERPLLKVFSLAVLLSVARPYPLVSAMQQSTPAWSPVPAQNRPSPHAWVSTPLQPRCMRVWTHTIEAPVVFEYQPQPNPEYLTRHISQLGRGVPPVGDFVWTTPTVVQGVTHLLHVPPNSASSMVFWLLHYRGRATVVAVPPGQLDWARLAQLALDSFGADIFRRNAFSIQHQSYVFPFGSNVPMPSHGAILHLVRSIQAPSSSFTTWENVPETIGMLHFDYDICEGPGGERCLEPDFAADSSGTVWRPASATASTQVAAAPAVLLTRQVNEVVAQVKTLTLRLETAGILPASATADNDAWEGEQAPSRDGTSTSWTPVDAPGSGSSGVGHRVSPYICALLGWHIRQPMLGFLFGCLVLARGDGNDCSSEEAPEPPSSPDLTEVQPPTPVTVPPNGGHGVNDADAIVRPSDSELARTSIPRVDTAFVGAPAFDLTTIPALQRRVAAALSDVDTEVFPRPFLPAGCPVVMHNPFTARRQVQIITSVVDSPRVLRDVLHDFATRRGWQQLVCVTPQPDEAAIHFVPAANNHDLVAVVLRTAAVVEPRCMAHTLPAAHYHSVTINGRTGRLRLPYHVRRGTDQVVRLRDGDCLHADVGPWGPPPPTPASSDAGRPSFSRFSARLLIALAFGRSHPSFLGAYAMLAAPSAWEYLQVGSFPWWRDRSQATLRLVGGPTPCRCLFLCPWTGRHASIQGTADTTFEQVQATLQQALFGHAQLQPVWPSIRRTCLAFVPQNPGADTVCVVGLLAGVTHPCMTPNRIFPNDLARVLQHRIGCTVDRFRLPPALKTRHITCPDEPLHLRDGDVIDIVDPERPAVVADVRCSIQLKDHTLWTRDFCVGACLTVRLWFPHIRQPILTWLRDGEHWDSDTLTFRPHFAVRYPGRWIPVPWAPGSTTHLVQASDNPHVVATLINASDGVRGMSIVPRITGSELADVLHTSPTDARVLGLPAVPPAVPLDLRDGDVVWDSLLYGEPDVSWTRLEEEVSGAGMTCLSVLLTRSGAAGALFIWTSWLTGAAAMRRLSSSERSRSRSPSPLSSGPWIGRWRPDVDTPFERVTHQGHVDYRVLCPFRGWSPFYYVRPASPADELLSAVTDFSGDWSTGCTLVGATHPRLPLVALPKLGHRLVTCVVTSGVHTRAFLYPASACYHDLHQYCHKILGLNDMQLSRHPAIRRYALLSTACFYLRHGDAFDMYPAESHHDFRATPRTTFKYLGDLQHHHAWHQEFRVLYGGRVKVWHHDEQHEYTCRQHKIVDGSIWTPVVGRFRAPRSLPGNTPWIPAHCVDDGWCHFVQAPESGRVGVLLQKPDRPVRCLSLAAPGNVGSAPPGWQLRSDLKSRLEGASLRNGDVLVPVASSAHSAGIPAVLAGLP